MTSFGAFVGNNASDVRQFQEWSGREVDFVRAHGGRANWPDYNDSLDWLAHQFEGVDKPIYWSVPMFVNGGTLRDGAAGQYDQHYLKAAQSLLQASGDGDKIYVRVGEEFNGSWMPWSAAGRESEFIETFRNFVETFRSVSDKFVFEWNVNIGNMGMNPADAYPGDAYVDVIGMDFYWNTAWDPSDPDQAWEYMVGREYGLQWLEDFARAHGKPTAYSEWGVGSDNAENYISQVAEWFASHNVLYQSYWNSNSDYQGKLSDGQFAATGSAFVDAFSEPDDAAPAGPVPEEAALSQPHPAPETATETDEPVEDQVAGSSSSPDWPAPAPSGDWQRWIEGTAGDDEIIGTSKNDKIDGRSGKDRMVGGAGDDQYTVDLSGDIVEEAAGQGVDSVYSYAKTYTLAKNVEHLTLDGTYNQTGIGNALANRIAGGQGNDTIDGQGGDDWLTGGAGRDVFVFQAGDGHDVITDFETGAGGDVLHLDEVGFRSFADIQAAMTTENGATILRLPTGGSVTLLGLDSDLSESDVSISPSYIPPTPSGSWETWIGGSSANDRLNGTARNDKIDGSRGADRMIGKAGDDTYTVDNARDVVVETAGQGMDTVHSYAKTFRLAYDVEHLDLIGNYDQKGIGNGSSNRIQGGTGNDTIEGRGGDDWLCGGGGRDLFVFGVGGGNDVIADFDVSGSDADRLDLRSLDLVDFPDLARSMVQRSSNIEIDLPGDNSVVLLGVTIDQLDSAHFLL